MGEVNTVYQVAGMSQPTDCSCWATSFAVIINYRDSASHSPQDIADAVGWDISQPEDWSTVTDTAQAWGLRQTASACMNVDGWNALLQAGPLWLSINGGHHAVVLNGIEGDGTAENTVFYVTDPWDGAENLGLNGLNAMFERLGASAGGDELIIWHQ